MLETKKLTYKPHKQTLLDEITLAFVPGKIYGILGPNGAGKTTLLKTLCGIWKPTSGSVLWQEQNLFELERIEISRVISLVPQGPVSYFDFSVKDIVAMGRYAHQSQTPNIACAIVEEALKKVDVWHLRDRKITGISAGERQRVYIGRALTTEAPILLLDEPTANLDISHQRDVWEILKNLIDRNRIIIVTMHDFVAAEQQCDEVIILNEGKCVAKGIL